MNINDYLEPVSLDKPDEGYQPETHTIGANIRINTASNPVDDLSNYKIAILGVPEDRNSNNKGTSLAPDKIRSNLYRLTKTSEKNKIIDLGNLKQGNTFDDTYFALRDVIFELQNNQVITIIIGGSQDLTYPVYQAYKETKESLNLTCIDKKIDIDLEEKKFNSETYLSKILLNKNTHLFKFVNLAHQQYLINPKNADYLNTVFHDALRLGWLKNDITAAEPILRDTDIVSFDISAIKQSDAPAHQFPSPNGLFADEACQIARYAGISDHITNFGLYEVNPKFDLNNQTHHLAAQVIWYFIDGISARKTEFPSSENTDFKTFIVGHENMDYEIMFYKSLVSGRWWMEIPLQNQKNKIISCSPEDYQLACKHEIPDLWWKSYQKLV
ncbi:MAG: formimidoylglutamase [Bacteroidales bacterium]|nr:formimidoylglutamase [Bacteroidales bacterium]